MPVCARLCARLCAASGEEYELLQKLNMHAANKYEHMADQAIKLVSAINTVNATQASMESFFAQIDQLEANVSEARQQRKETENGGTHKRKTNEWLLPHERVIAANSSPLGRVCSPCSCLCSLLLPS